MTTFYSFVGQAVYVGGKDVTKEGSTKCSSHVVECSPKGLLLTFLCGGLVLQSESVTLQESNIGDL